MQQDREFTFKPAALRQAQTWSVREGHLARRGADKALRLAAVKQAVWGSFAYRGTRSQWLHLTGPEGVVKVECNSIDALDEAQFLDLVAAIATGLEAENPDLGVMLGGGEAYRWSLFLIGLVGAVLGVVLLVSALTGGAGQGAAEGLIAGALILVLTLPLALNFQPWRGRRTLPPSAFRALIGRS